MPEEIIVTAIQLVATNLRIKIYKQVEKELAAQAKLYRKMVADCAAVVSTGQDPNVDETALRNKTVYQEVAVCLEEDSCGWGLKAHQLEETLKPKEAPR